MSVLKTVFPTEVKLSSPLVHVVLLSLSLPWIRVTLGTVAVIVRRRLAPRVGVLRVSSCKPQPQRSGLMQCRARPVGALWSLTCVPGGGCDGV